MSGLIEVDVNRTPGKAPRIAKRLQNSPKTLFPSTPEKLQQRQEKAAEVRKVRFKDWQRVVLILTVFV
jgi:hypothetical protein